MNNRIKIAYLTDQFLPSSSADTEQLINMVAALGKQTKVSLISACNRFGRAPSKEQLKDYYVVDGEFELKFIRQLFPNIRGIEKIGFAIKSALKLKNQSEVKLIYTRNISVLIASLFFTEKPVVYETYRPWPKRNIQARWFFKRIANHPRLLGIILHSKFAQSAFLDIGFNKEKLIVEHNAVSADIFDNIRDNKLKLRRKYNLPENIQIVTYTGRVTEIKGLDYFLELANSFPEELFLIIGSEGRGAIERKAEKIPNVRVITWQDKSTIAEYIIASDILYIPTSLMAREKAKNTVLPLKTFIYKASGKAILAPDIEDIREVLSHKKTAYLVKADNNEAAIHGLKELLENQLLRVELGNAAKKEMETLTWENRAKRVLNFIETRLNILN